MNRNTFNAMAAQYAVKETAGEGELSWDGGVRCVLPEVQIGGKVERGQYQGYNRLKLGGTVTGNEVTVSFDSITQIFTINGIKTSPGNIVLSSAANIVWDGATRFWTVRQKISGNVAFGDKGSLLWSVFSNDYSAYTARTMENASYEGAEFLANQTGSANKIDESPSGTGYRIVLQISGCSADSPVVFDNYRCRLMLTDIDIGIPTAYEDFFGNLGDKLIISEGTKVMSIGENRLLQGGGIVNSSGVTASYDPVTRIFTLNGTQTSPQNLRLGDSSKVVWEGYTDYRFFRSHVGGEVEFRNPAQMYWGIFTQDWGKFGRTLEHVGNAPLPTVCNGTFAKISDDATYRITLQLLNCSEECPIVFKNYQVRLGIIPAERYTKDNYDSPLNITYCDGGNAIAPKLLAVPETDFKDTWDATTGKGVRRCAVIERYSGEPIDTPYISSRGDLSDGAYVIYGIVDTPFQTDPQPLTSPHGAGQIVQTGGNLDGVPITVKYVTHS